MKKAEINEWLEACKSHSDSLKAKQDETDQGNKDRGQQSCMMQDKHQQLARTLLKPSKRLPKMIPEWLPPL